MTERYGFVVEIDGHTNVTNQVVDGSPHEATGPDIFIKSAPVPPSALSRGLETPLVDGSTLPIGKGHAHRGRRNSALGRLVVWCLVAAALLGAFGYLHEWWTLGRFLESTNDGYVKADQVAMAPRVLGYVSEVLVEDNQSVQIGQPLVRIDAENYRMALTRQRAVAQAREAEVAAAEARVQQHFATIEQARVKLDSSQITASFAGREAERYRSLRASGAESAERLSQMTNNRDQANDAVRFDRAALEAAEHQTDILQAEAGQARAQSRAAQAVVLEADLDVGNTLIRASIAGRVGDRTVRVGQFVQPGTRLLSIVPVQNIYVVANFKETQISEMRVWQPASISVDALRGHVLRGVLESFAPSTGAQFALLPPENATGNFTKIVQRVPVRFRLEVDDDVRARLLPGLSVTVEIDTRNLEPGAESRR
jgi:membrane fusion protein (multidrug efflux system)